ncbi:Gfo/Idh/MocA family oxidoreductase [Salinisphaera sp. LB1]|uniref:Gfo/Idh/MocA family oxidoreductase n=1 Tax=Salinisphaera sp. LB1 TaxID=2183911 RepID=UPI000D708863|nr:Gfo/Idh/MocA family oxidoreductase [Salinisphaera sp. LB1]AWN15625.1 Myo-inositol 2-dehydrogenase [Salinisphaera sp. LB1]
MPDRLRIAVIGYGTAGRIFHAPLIHSTPDLELAAIVTGNAERAAEIGDRYPGARVIADTETLWARASAFDAVVVASPNGWHAAHAQTAIATGLAVVVDKPLAASADQAETLIAAARNRGVALTVFQNRRWDADFLTLRALIEAGRLGTVRRFESRFERWRPEPKPGWKRDAAPDAAGGILFDLGSHLIDQALTLFGPAREVYAELDAGYADSAVDDDSFVALRHSSGVRSHLWMSSVAPDLGPRLRVLGDRAGFVKYGLDPQEERLRDGAVPGHDDWGTEPENAWGRLGAGEQFATIPSHAGDYPAFYRRFAAALREQSAMPVDPGDAVAGLRVIEAARTAAAERRVVSL